MKEVEEIKGENSGRIGEEVVVGIDEVVITAASVREVEREEEKEEEREDERDEEREESEGEREEDEGTTLTAVFVTSVTTAATVLLKLNREKNKIKTEMRKKNEIIKMEIKKNEIKTEKRKNEKMNECKNV